MKDSFISPSTGKGAAVVMGSPGPVIGNQSIELDLLLSFLTGKKPYYFEDEQPNPRINYTIEEINSFLSNIPRLSQYQFYGKGDLDYLLYRQPRIVSLIIKDENDSKIYEFQHENTLNPESEYISEEKLNNSRIKQVKLDTKLKFSISFSDNVDISEKAADLLSKSNGYSFKLYKNRLPNTSDHNRKDCYVEATKVKVGSSLKSTEMIFDLTDFKKCEEEFDSNFLYFVAKVPDSYKHDEMVYLDTVGSGRDDKRGRCKHKEGCKYPYDDITANDGLDTNHWLQINPIPKMTVSSMEIDELHLPFQQAPPDGRVNMQPVMMNGDIALPENFSWQMVTCDDKTGFWFERCIYNINQHNYNDNLEPTYYLNSKMLKPFTFDPETVETVDELIDALAPVFHAELSDKNADLESLVADGSIKDYIDIYLEGVPYQPGEGQMARNYAGPPMEPIKIDKDIYYAFFFKSAANNILIALPLKNIFLDRYPSLPDCIKI